MTPLSSTFYASVPYTTRGSSSVSDGQHTITVELCGKAGVT
jgi:hypothetical protein